MSIGNYLTALDEQRSACKKPFNYGRAGFGDRKAEYARAKGAADPADKAGYHAVQGFH